MKLFITLSMALLLAFQTCNKVYLVVYYQINKEYIAKYLCKNKDNPISSCNGKCFLKDKLEEATANEKGEDKAIVPNWNQTDYETNSLFDFIILSLNLKKEIRIINTDLISSILVNIFKPPI